MTGLITQFTTSFGTPTLGMNVTFKHEAIDQLGTIDAGSTLTIDLEMNIGNQPNNDNAFTTIDISGSAFACEADL